MRNLARLAFKSENTLGRFLPPEFDRDSSLYWMNSFGLDDDKIKCSKAFRRLSGKTQVISGHKNIHIRDRLIHSMEVQSIATQIGLRLGLNVPLIQASALGHDLGHVAFGHLGESFIAKKLGENFRHERFAIFVLEMIERDESGLNLSYETLHAIRNHSRGSGRMIKNGGVVLEDDVLMICDKLSYIFSDFNDMNRVKFESINISDETVEKISCELAKLGSNQTERLYACARAFCLESLAKGAISFEDSEEARCFNVVRNFMYEEVYHKIDRAPLSKILDRVFTYFEKYFKNSRAAALALALMAEEGVYILDSMIGNFSDAYIKGKVEDTSLFAIAEFLPKISKWAELDFCDSDRFLNKKNFGKIPKIECFSR